MVLAGALFVLLMLFLAHRPIVAVTLDRESARAAGVHVLLADLSLYVAVALAVVISVQTIGNVLVLTACFVLAWVFAPRHGVLARSLRERRG